jgi:hypothetical protein
MMAKKIGAGAIAGLIGGLVSALLLQLVHVSSDTGIREPAMRLVTGAVHARTDAAGWLAYLVYAVIIGGLFGWLLWKQEVDEGTSLAWGALYGAFWWIASGLVVIPALRGIAPFTPAAVDVVRAASFPWLAAMIVDGLVLGGVFATLAHRLTTRAASRAAAPPTRRAA